MDRRTFLTIAVGGLLAVPRAGVAQQLSNIPRIGVLTFGDPPTATHRFNPNDGFRDGLRSLGYVEGRNVVVERRYAEARTERLAKLAADLVRVKVDVIFAGGPVVLEALMKATASVPIVVVCCSDAVREGWAQSVARPGRNITGLTVTYPEIGGKRLALLKETVPELSRAALLVEPVEIPNWNDVRQVLDDSARAMSIQLQILEVRGPGDFDRVFNDARQARAQGILTFDTAKILFHQRRLSELTVRNRLPSVGEFRSFAESGLLMTYGADLYDLTRRAAAYVDKILKGANPADLPVERPTKFELVLNLKTAKALGLTIPPSLLARRIR